MALIPVLQGRSSVTSESGKGGHLDSSKQAVLTVGGISLGYVAAYVPLYGLVGNSAGIFATIPVLGAAWFFGLYGGGLAGLLTLPLSALLVTQFASEELGAWARGGREPRGGPRGGRGRGREGCAVAGHVAAEGEVSDRAGAP